MREKQPARLLSLSLSIALALLLGGCISRSMPSSFYALSSVERVATASEGASTPRTASIAVGPVDLPHYLNRQQIVTRTGGNELTISEQHRWAGSLDDDIARVITENLSTALAGRAFAVSRWQPSGQSSPPAAYRVGIDVTGFEGTPGGSVSLKASWTVFEERTGDVLTAGNAHLEEPAGGDSYSDLVRAMSSALGQLSGIVAADVESILGSSSQ